MSLPTFTFEVGFGAAPLLDSPAFTNLAADLETLAVSRGRQTEDDTASTGTCRGTLIDDTRKYDPNNAAGPFFPNVQPMQPVRVLATLDGVTYPVFYGWIDVQNGWVRIESNAGFATVSVPCNDGFEILNNGRIFTRAATTGFWLAGSVGFSEAGTTTVAAYVDPPAMPVAGADFGQELTGTRINNLLGATAGGDVIGITPVWPSTWRSIDAGNEQIQAVTQANDASSTALQLIRDAEITEPGFFFFDGRGFACFRDRRSRPFSVSQATFCDTHNLAAGRILFDSVTTRRSLVVNDARVTRSGGTLQEAIDTTSQTKLMTRTKDYSTQHIDDSGALTYAQWILSLKKDSLEVLESLTLRPGTDSSTWVQILSRELNDRITVVRTPPGGGAAITEDYFIEAINITYGPGPDASCSWRLARADQTTLWLAGVAGASEAGTTTKAGY